VIEHGRGVDELLVKLICGLIWAISRLVRAIASLISTRSANTLPGAPCREAGFVTARSILPSASSRNQRPRGLARKHWRSSYGFRPTASPRSLRGPAASPETALRLRRYFGTGAKLWIRLQADFDLSQAEQQFGDGGSREVAGQR
jgi:hypothetical protein